ncbi:S24 family peptidase [uncultured Pseudomonas sp.]|uniref:LexA family protein n=1 Tax=uncultured Pseudomonas sp. TaxID=114707 RepID=UPI0030DD851A|tara:strand:+ start:317 stop:952 length:636 start_codon:yes stop_codon:yes gene_type:complete
MTIYDTRYQNTRRLLAERAISLKALADLLGKAPAQVSAFAGKNPHKNIGEQIAREIEKAFNIPKGSLDYPEHNNVTQGNVLGRQLPVIGSVVAGTFCESFDEFHPGDAEEWIEAPGPVGPNAFVLRIEGISMEDKFFDGDKVVIDPSLEAAPGCFVVAKRVRDQAVTFKQLRKEGDQFYLYALNESWPDRVILLNEEWHICGRARWKISDL